MSTFDSLSPVQAQRELKKKLKAVKKLKAQHNSAIDDKENPVDLESQLSLLEEEIVQLQRIAKVDSPIKTEEVQSPVIESNLAASGDPTLLPKVEQTDKKDTEEKNEEIRLENLILGVISSNDYSKPTLLSFPSSGLTRIHPQIAEFGLLCESYRLVGGNARTFAMIRCFRELLLSIPLLATDSLRDVEQQLCGVLDHHHEYLNHCRPTTPGMRHVIHLLKRRLSKLASSPHSFGSTKTFTSSCVHISPLQANDSINDILSGSSSISSSFLEKEFMRFRKSDPQPPSHMLRLREAVVKELDAIEEELRYSFVSIITDRAQQHYTAHDTIAVFGRSSTVEFVLRYGAFELQKRPQIIVIDSSPLFEGRVLASRLQEEGFIVSYGLVNQCCVLLPLCTKVFIGASAVLRSGEVFNRSGTALVASCAKEFRIPVLCFTEGYKFEDKVLLDSFSQNTEMLIDGGSIHDSRLTAQQLLYSSHFSSLHHMGPAHYLYDLTPSSYVDMIVSEMGVLHPSAIAGAIRLREEREELLEDSR